MRTLVVLSSLAIVIGLSALSNVIADLRVVVAIELPASPPIAIAEPAREPHPPARLAFRHSVISGGAYTADEVEEAMGRDGVVAAHYSGVNPRELRVETLPDDRAVYMSYRIGDKVFWTKQKVRLQQGETILTDGVHSIRARCGNCIASAPMEPTADDEPGEMEFDALADEPEIVHSRPPLVHELLVPPLFGFPLPWLLDSSSDPFARNDVVATEWIDVPFFGHAADPTEPALPGDLPEIVWTRFGEGEPSTDGFLPPIGPSPFWRPQYPGDPGSPDTPGDPGDPGDPHYPIFPLPEDPVVVPEPTTLLLVGGGLATLVARRRGRRGAAGSKPLLSPFDSKRGTPNP